MTTVVERIQQAKNLVWRACQVDARGVVPEASTFAPDVAFHGPAPIETVVGRDETIESVYRPLAAAFTAAVRRPYLFLGGVWNDAVWTAACGTIDGELTSPWLGIPPTGKPVTVRFGEFHRVVDGRIVEVRCLFDILSVATQAGFELLPPVKRPESPPGPAAGNGLCLDRQDPDESRITLQLVNDMLGGCNRLVGDKVESMGMGAYWHDDMAWYGPWGVGTALGFDEFQREAQGPSVASFPNRRGGFHHARIADGVTAAFTGWPSLRGTFDGRPFRGIEPTGGPIGQNIMDFYVRRGTKLHENWVLIDLIDFARQCNVDLLEGLPA